ncbi:MAG: DUF72 domain-containing protein [Fidelibacterota bacterium]
MAAEIRIGTSGFSFKDWIGNFYPENIEKGSMLQYYTRYFDAVEINSTYYNIPHPAVFYHLSRKTPEDFEFIIKTHKATTHERSDGGRAVDELLNSLKPLFDSGKMKGLLAQFPWSFKNTEQNLDYLLSLKGKVGEIPLFVEFRNIDWIKPDIMDLFIRSGIGFVCVDQPRLRGLIPPVAVSTSNTGYVRFHGRNTLTWWDSSKGDRYDYLYTRDELLEWREKIRQIQEKTDKLYLFFNNCHHGQAAQNALEMKELFSEY